MTWVQRFYQKNDYELLAESCPLEKRNQIPLRDDPLDQVDTQADGRARWKSGGTTMLNETY